MSQNPDIEMIKRILYFETYLEKNNITKFEMDDEDDFSDIIEDILTFLLKKNDVYKIFPNVTKYLLSIKDYELYLENINYYCLTNLVKKFYDLNMYRR